MLWYRQDRVAVQTAMEGDERPDLATTIACRPLDELIALHDELGIFALLDEVEVARKRSRLPGLLLRTPPTLPFVAEATFSGAAGNGLVWRTHHERAYFVVARFVALGKTSCPPPRRRRAVSLQLTAH